MTLTDCLTKTSVTMLTLFSLMTALPVHAQFPPPEERSTPETIQFESVDDERLGETTIKGALGPASAGPISESLDTMVEPVHLSDELMRSLDLEEEDAEAQRTRIFDIERDLAPRTPRVQLPGFENRTYSPSSRTSTTVRE